MNRTIIATVTIIAVAAVAIFGLRTYTQATTAPSPVTVHDADVNWDGHINVADLGLVASKYAQLVPVGGRPVAEQNLDSNGNIKVHEQGTVDVNLIPAGRTIPVVTGDTLVAVNDTVTVGGFVNVEGCNTLDAYFTYSPVGGSPNSASLAEVTFDLSLDGATYVANPSTGGVAFSFRDSTALSSSVAVHPNSTVAAPFVRIKVRVYPAEGGPSYPSLTVHQVLLYCR